MITDNQSDDITLDDIISNPKDFGAPTFEEFAKNPEKWKFASEHVLNMVDVGSLGPLKKFIAKQTYEIAGYKCDSLEEVERIAKNEGYDIRFLEINPQVIKEGGDKYSIHVVFQSGRKQREKIFEQVMEDAGYPQGK